MKGISKDLIFVFGLSIIITIFTSTNLFENFNLNIVFFLVIFVLSGYSLQSVLYPEEKFNDLLRKPVLLIELSVFMTVLISLILKYSALRLNLKDLTLILSVIAVILSITALIIRNKRLKSGKSGKKLEKADEKFFIKTPLKKEFDDDVYEDGKYIQCEECKGVYKLGEGESLEDFESCRCGGKLREYYGFLPETDITSDKKGTNLTKIFKIFQKWSEADSFQKKPFGENFDSIVVISTILLGIMVISCTIATPVLEENFTEFYILDSAGKSDNYPHNLIVGQEGKVIIGIVNHEYHDINYRIVVKYNNTTIENKTINLAPNQKYEYPFTFRSARTGKNRDLVFLLYKTPESREVYQSLHMWINVS